MKKLTISRRTVLRGMLGGAAITVALPPLEAFFNTNGTALADGSVLPKRFGIWYWGNGVVPEHWVPPNTGKGFTLSKQLEAFAPVHDKITIVSGTQVYVPNIEPHHSGWSGMLTGAPMKVVGGRKIVQAPTIDQVVAKSMEGKTRFRSLEWGAKPGQGVSVNGPDSINPYENSPRAFFDRVFGDGFSLPGEGGQVDPMLGLRRSVLDAVSEDAKSLRPRLSASDRIRLDQHFTGIRELERRIAFIETHPPDLQACAKPAEPEESYPDIEGRPQLPAIHRAMADIMVMALACDQTRVFNSVYVESVSNNLFPGATSGHHQLTHDELGDQPQVHAITLQIMQEFAYFLEKLNSVEEGAGTLLDNCLVLGTTDSSLAKTHSLVDYPILLAGSAGGAIQTGVHYASPTKESSTKVLLTIVRAMDMVADEYGMDDARVTDSLTAIEVL